MKIINKETKKFTFGTYQDGCIAVDIENGEFEYMYVPSIFLYKSDLKEFFKAIHEIEKLLKGGDIL